MPVDRQRWIDRTDCSAGTGTDVEKNAERIELMA